jgi:hypothetical protein
VLGNSFADLVDFIDCFERRDHFIHVRMKVTAHDVENFNDQRMAYGIEDLIARLAIDNDVSGAKHGEVLRSVGLLDTKPLDDCAGGQLPISQLLDNRDASRVRQCLKEFGLELAQRIRVDYSNIRNILYNTLLGMLSPNGL